MAAYVEKTNPHPQGTNAWYEWERQRGRADDRGQPIGAAAEEAAARKTQSGLSGADVFSDPSRLAGNPFVAGTKEYDNWNKEKISVETEMAGMPPQVDFIRPTAGGEGQPYGFKEFKDAVGYTPETLDAAKKVDYQSVIPQAEGKFQDILGGRSTAGFEAFQDRALGTGPSPWLSLQLERQGLEESGRLDEVARQAAGSSAEQQSNLAMRGGLSSGARERVGTSSIEEALRGMQGVRSGGQAERLGLQIEDAQSRDRFLSALPGEERAQIQPDLDVAKFLTEGGMTEAGRAADVGFKNIANEMDVNRYNVDEANKGEQYNIEKYLADLTQERVKSQLDYTEQAKGAAAIKTGEAIAGQGKK